MLAEHATTIYHDLKLVDAMKMRWDYRIGGLFHQQRLGRVAIACICA